MKLQKNLIPALLAVIIGGTAQLAQASGHMDGQHAEKMQQRMEEMKKELNLTDDQVKQMQELQKKHKAERERMRKEMDDILTPEQREKMKQMRKERMGKHRDKDAG